MAKLLPRTNKYGCYEIRVESLGGFGANVAGKILAQAGILGMGLNGSNFASYGSEKMGSPVKTYLRFTEGEVRINSPVTEPHLIALFVSSIAAYLPVFEGLEEDGVVVVNSPHSPEEIRDQLKIPGNTTVYCVDAQRIAIEEKVRANTPMMGAICRASGFLDHEEVKKYTEQLFKKRYPHTVEPNKRAIQRGFDECQIKQFPEDNKYPRTPYKPFVSPLGYDTAPMGGTITDFANGFGKDLSGSRVGYVAVYDREKCIDCAQCEVICPDLCIVWDEGVDKKGNPAMVMKGIDYTHCKGCLRCVEVCPTEALTSAIEEDLPAGTLQSVSIRDVYHEK